MNRLKPEVQSLKRTTWMLIATGIALGGFTFQHFINSDLAFAQRPVPTKSLWAGGRSFYLTKNTATGSQARKACTTSFHMASAWELANVSLLQYDTGLGRTRADSDLGPPSESSHVLNSSNFAGFVHTGYDSYNSTPLYPGLANCSAYTSDVGGGTALFLITDWNSVPGPPSVVPIASMARWSSRL
jgi:hypothetical protein